MGGIKMKNRDAAQKILKEFFGRRKKIPIKKIEDFKNPKVIIDHMENFWFDGKKKISPNDKVSKFGFDELDIVDFLIWLQRKYKTTLKEPSDRVVKGWITNGKIIDIIKYVLNKKNWG